MPSFNLKKAIGRTLVLILAILLSSSARAGLLTEIAKEVSVNLISEVGKMAIQRIASQLAGSPAEREEREKIVRLVSQLNDTDLSDEVRFSAYAPQVDFLSEGIVAPQAIVEHDRHLRSIYKFRHYRVLSIDGLEVSIDKKYAAVVYTLGVAHRGSNVGSRDEAGKVRIAVLISSFETRPRVVAIKDWATTLTPPPAVQRAIAEVDRLNELCRGGSGDNPETMKACDARDSLLESQVRSRGWCWGDEQGYQAGYQRGWQLCAPEFLPAQVMYGRM